MIESGLLARYCSAVYEVETADGLIVLRIGERSDAVAALLASLDAMSGAFVSAVNPRSKVLPEAENARRHEALIAEVTELGLTAFPGCGRDRAGKWREPSLLITGMERDAADRLADRFAQNAYLWISAHGRVSLRTRP